jgi:nucleoside-diphosphate-sugar epimerase
MRVFLTGATGFVGHYILQELLRQGHSVRCLVREGSLDKLPLTEGDYRLVDSSKDRIVAGDLPRAEEGASRAEVVYGDVTDLESIEGDLTGCDAVIHLVGVIDEDRHRGITFEAIHVRGTRNVVEQARAAGVQRFIHMSANGARDDRDASRYHTTKWQAEEMVRGAGFEHAVIFRPSILFGDPGEDRPEFASRLAADLVAPFPILPVLGDGQYRLQPIHVSVVAAAFVKALTLETPNGGVPSYCVAGEESFTFDEVLDRISTAMGRGPKSKVHLPLGLSKLMVNSIGALGLLPISPAQFRMLIDGNTCDASAFRKTFEPRSIPFDADHLSYLRESR